MPHVPIYASPEFDGRSGPGLYTDVIEEIDWSVGQVLSKLEEKGILNKTLVVFSSDNGPWLVMREMGGTAGPLREGKQYTFEGGQRVPTLALWPEVIPAGIQYDDAGLMMDWFPTIAEIAGLEIPADRDYDGESILPVLKGEQKAKPREFLYYNGHILRGYRNGDWKLKLPFEGYRGSRGKQPVYPHDTLLFNLKTDPGETTDLSASEPAKVAEMVELMKAFEASKGEYPPSLDIGQSADHDFYRILAERHGDDYWKIDW
jgi:arylsulfatase A-like enzyme